MNASSILLPMLVQISLTLLVLLFLGVRKKKALKTGNVDITKTALNNSAWPDDVVKVSNNIANQFQTPNLFYVLCIIFYLTNSVSTLVLVFSWVYVVTRIIHAYVHMNSNYVPVRLSLFIVGTVCLISMTVTAFINISF